MKIKIGTKDRNYNVSLLRKTKTLVTIVTLMKKLLLVARPSEKQLHLFFLTKIMPKEKIALIEENGLASKDKDSSSFEYLFFKHCR